MRHAVARILLAASIGVTAAGCAALPEPPHLGPPLTHVHHCDPVELGAVPAGGAAAPASNPPGVEFSCATLTVPLDHPGVRPGPDRPGHLELSVAVSDNVRAPLGILIRLVGGPGEPGLPLAADISAHEIEPAVRQAYRLVFINQRGTGPGALQCPQLQQALGDSDLTVPPAAAVQSCADALGDARRFYTTADTVADLESLRIALRAPQLTLDGTSYGSFVAARYALAYPNRVSRLVLDSVVPHDGLDPLQLAAFARAGPVLAMACRETGCTTDPAGDLASVVRKRHDGPQLLDVLTGLTAGKPRLAQLPAALHAAASGDYTELDAISQAELHDAATPAEHLSQGLHTATACEDLTSTGPWGDAATPVLGRRKSIAKAVAALPEQTFFPFDRDTATGNGTMVTCQQWPSTPVPAFVVGRDLPPVPVLLLAGDHDLDTPLAWTRQEAARAPRGQLIVIPGSGHITQDAANGPAGREAAARFLTSPP